MTSRALPAQVDVIEFLNAMPLEAVGPLVQRCRARGPLYHAALDAAECGALERMLGRLDAIAARAKALGVVRRRPAPPAAPAAL